MGELRWPLPEQRETDRWAPFSSLSLSLSPALPIYPRQLETLLVSKVPRSTFSPYLRRRLLICLCPRLVTDGRKEKKILFLCFVLLEKIK